MAIPGYQPKRLFTVEQANAMLPLVRAICTDLSRLSLDVIERRQRLNYLATGEEREPGDPYSDEVAQIEAEIEQDAARLQEYVAELSELGVEPKNGVEGLVDFPCEMDGRIVYLCWKLQEPEVLHWHELDAGFAGRQPLTASSALGNEEGLGGSIGS